MKFCILLYLLVGPVFVIGCALGWGIGWAWYWLDARPRLRRLHALERIARSWRELVEGLERALETLHTLADEAERTFEELCRVRET